MPNVSEAQRRAMAAAAAGNSTLGIPKKVGTEFMGADKGGKLPEHVEDGKPARRMSYGHARSAKARER